MIFDRSFTQSPWLVLGVLVSLDLISLLHRIEVSSKMIPREHGAWAMLVAPFLGATLLARQWHWLILVAAAAVGATFLAACISATGTIQPWCWWFWGLSASQAAAGILVVHSRLEARIAARKINSAGSTFRTPALLAQAALLAGAVAFGILGRPWLAVA